MQKIIKAQKKDIYNSEKKNSDLVEQIASLKAGRSDLTKEKANVANELKILQNKPTKKKTSNSVYTQTELPPNLRNSSEENSIPSASSSMYTQTSSCESDTESQLLECLVCSERFTAEDQVLHAVVDQWIKEL